MRNVVAVSAIVTSVALGRTVKLKLSYRHGVEAVAKFPQLKFPYEAYGEYVAYEVDRLLGVSMVPPTAWCYVPVGWVEAAAAEYEGEFGGGRSYSQFVSTELLEHALRNRLVIVHPSSGRTAIGASVQLWLHDVVQQQDSDLAFPDDYRMWFREPLTRPRSRRRFAYLMRSINGMLVLDTVIGNKDRSASKNAHVAGGCTAEACLRKGGEGAWSRAHRGPSEFVLLDQGKSWYEEAVPDNGPFRDPDTTFCAFRRDLYGVVQRLASGSGGVTLTAALTEVLPRHIFDTIGQTRIGWGQKRVEHLARIMRRCVAEKGEDWVFGWEGSAVTA